MSDLLPDGEDLRRAVRWISEMRKEEHPLPLAKLIEDASLKFDLSPRDQEFVFNVLTRKE